MFVNISKLPKDMRERLAHKARLRFRKKAEIAMRQQREVAQANRDGVPGNETLGELKMSLMPLLHWDAAHTFGGKNNPDHGWHQDPDKVKHYLRRDDSAADAARVKVIGTRIQMGYEGRDRARKPEDLRTWVKSGNKLTMNFGNWDSNANG
jgi:hypothetical protein